MKWIVVALIISALAGLVFAALKTKRNGAHLAMKKPLSDPEQILFHRLVQALPENVVLAQVSFSRFLRATGGNRKENWGEFATIKQKVADYLICKKDFSVVAAIELDDSKHNAERDKKRDQTLKEAGLKTIRWNVKNLPNVQEIRTSVQQLGERNERNE
jgi:hypothetical protein